ncbi:glycine cleavage system aminomethyltransferase GcvT [Siminovitchia fortis]|uniref:Aminomethyltransferase n=1 Tax=Siminovitchia fortis TaxID=254758 RepID=A0A443J437_9BACI|nr:glycine cleavage system aminomethyltransferase GcvT [Siminovitchia fortis]RWR15105.1 glycine cleavage system aminomethyltransferase GcvT [Siminovitchia fortis]WHY82757.1 glycine cleavage system aminomethyltransferase GcvT [Siminovitchia fortis]
MSELKKTPLYPLYKEYGAKTIDFGGWDMPVQFSGIKEEHEAVRKNAGIFDVSHMGEIIVKGKNSLDFLQKMMTNDFSRLKDGGALYTAMCYENGGVVDDLLVYKLSEEEYFLVVNAANTEKDYEWLKQHAPEGVSVENVSDQYALIAIQGPKAQSILQKLSKNTNLDDIGFFKFRHDVELDGAHALVSRTGYTGEDGFEIYCQADDAEKLWRTLLEIGKDEGLVPCGLGARDTLRFEAALPLYGQELSPEITPLEAGIGFAVKLNKEADFIGKEALKRQKEQGVERRIAGVEMIDRGIPRNGYRVFSGDKEIGYVTSGTQSPTLKKNIGLVLIGADYNEEGNEVEIEVRKKRLKAKIIQTPFYKRPKK